VKYSYRRKGIGEKLLQEMLKWFAAHELHRIELRVLSANEVGYNFWKKQGFRDYMHMLYLDVSRLWFQLRGDRKINLLE
jgi:ribosomal protein S18 acetylase RimI-like enzyme